MSWCADFEFRVTCRYNLCPTARMVTAQTFQVSPRTQVNIPARVFCMSCRADFEFWVTHTVGLVRRRDVRLLLHGERLLCFRGVIRSRNFPRVQTCRAKLHVTRISKSAYQHISIQTTQADVW